MKVSWKLYNYCILLFLSGSLFAQNNYTGSSNTRYDLSSQPYLATDADYSAWVNTKTMRTQGGFNFDYFRHLSAGFVTSTDSTHTLAWGIIGEQERVQGSFMVNTGKLMFSKTVIDSSNWSLTVSASIGGGIANFRGSAFSRDSIGIGFGNNARINEWILVADLALLFQHKNGWALDAAYYRLNRPQIDFNNLINPYTLPSWSRVYLIKQPQEEVALGGRVGIEFPYGTLDGFLSGGLIANFYNARVFAGYKYRRNRIVTKYTTANQIEFYTNASWYAGMEYLNESNGVSVFASWEQQQSDIGGLRNQFLEAGIRYNWKK